MTDYEIDYNFYGGNLDAIECQDAEVLLIGPAETGKTLGLLWKLHRVASKHAEASIVIARKTLTSTFTTVLRTWEEKILGDNPAVKAYGGARASWYEYSNGSRVYVTGLDKSTRILSAEHDLIYVNQAEELSLNDWETLTTRTTGRAGHIPYPQTIGDANPSYPQHWMYQRKAVTRFFSWHADNPMLYDPITGAVTTQGARTMARLDSLTGLRYKRLRLGQAAQAEGVVYEGFSEAIHILDPFDIPQEWRRIRAVDFGFTNAFVCQWWAIDPDGRMYLYREIYHGGILVEDHAKEIKRLSEGEQIEATVCDHDAEGRATLERYLGIRTIAARKSIITGIQTVETRLRRAGDGKPRLYVVRDALTKEDVNLREHFLPTCTEQEFAAYVWQKTADGRPNKEIPLDLNNHGMDAMRYGVMHLDAVQPVVQQTRNRFYA